MSDEEITDYTGEPVGGWSFNLTGQEEGERASQELNAALNDKSANDRVWTETLKDPDFQRMRAALRELWGWEPSPAQLTSSAQRTTFRTKGEQDHNNGE